jgi:hypothetical protein
MKKIALSILLLGFLFCVTSQNSHALIKPFSLYLSGGVQTDTKLSFDPLYWTAGANMDFSFALLPFAISPECYIIVNKFNFDAFWLAPAVMANLKLANLFVGAGLTKWFLIGTEVTETLSTDFMLKLNAGLKGPGVKLTVFAVTDFDYLFKTDYMWIGATISFGLL